MGMEDEFERRPFFTVTKLVLFIILLGFGASVVSCALNVLTNPARQGARVVNKIIDADNMLVQYRWFHDSSASLNLYPEKIKNAAKLEAWAEQHAPDRAMARQTELTGLQQTCLGLVGDYNSRAARLDAGFFRNPESWLPVSTQAYAPLPVTYPQDWCEPKEGEPK